MSYLDRIREANRRERRAYRPFRISGHAVGWVRHALAQRLRAWPDVFTVSPAEVALAGALDLPGTPPGARSAAVREVLLRLRGEGVIGGWRDEEYAVHRLGHGWADPPLLHLERAAVPHFGACGYGVHLNGYVRRAGAVHLWVARRSRSKPTDPGKLDHLAAGGQPAGLGLRANLAKECAEEAGIPPPLARAAVPVGTVTYALSVPEGLRPDVVFAFDLELPADFTPRNVDGEVEEFQLWPVERVAEVVAGSDAFKFNCALVIIDFLIRHGRIPPEHPDYAALVAGLRGREQFLIECGERARTRTRRRPRD